MTTLAGWLDSLIAAITEHAAAGTMLSQDYLVRGLIALVLVSFVAGAVGSLVVSNRMAFFSDALAHCAFSGVAIGFLLALVWRFTPKEFEEWSTLVMVLWGIGVGLLIAYVHEKTLLPSDTVIGVFFAGALGLGAIVSRPLRRFTNFDVEKFIFGDPLLLGANDLLWLFGLTLLTAIFLVFCYNPLLFGSFNPSLANSRRVPARLSRYLFIVLLALIVNLCQQTVGILLINGMLIVPGATASFVSPNLRQLLWWSIGLALFASIAGLYLSWELSVGRGIEVGIGGMILVLSVFLFGLAMLLKPLVRFARREEPRK